MKATAFAATQPEDARRFLERWLDTQNVGEFDAYQKLYADDFRGVRRSGPRSATFDRNSWLGDLATDRVVVPAIDRATRPRSNEESMPR